MYCKINLNNPNFSFLTILTNLRKSCPLVSQTSSSIIMAGDHRRDRDRPRAKDRERERERDRPRERRDADRSRSREKENDKFRSRRGNLPNMSFGEEPPNECY